MRRYALLSLIVFSSSLTFAAQTQPAEAAETQAIVPPDVLKVLEASLKAYRTAKTYSDEYILDTQVEGAGTERLNTGGEHKSKLAFAAPNKVAFSNDELSVTSDGKKLVEHLAPLEQYVERAAPAHLDFDKMALSKFDPFKKNLNPVVSFLTDADSDLLMAIGPIKEFGPLKTEKQSDGTKSLVTGTVSMGESAAPNDVPFTAVFNPTGLLEEIRYDFTKPASESTELKSNGIHVTRYVQRKRFVKPTLNGDLPEATWATHLGPYDKKVTDFEPVSPEELQHRMIGRPAPAFETVDLEAKPVSLAKFKGKIVILDFWATFCQPCVASMPYLQKLSEKYAKEPVAVVGVNGDDLRRVSKAEVATRPAAQFEGIAQFIKAHKLTYFQFMDPEGQVAGRYRVEGIPCVFLLDKEGIVRSIHIGIPRAGGPEAGVALLASEIDLLLKGKPLPQQATEAADTEK